MRYNKKLIQKAISHPGREFFSRPIRSGESTRCYIGVDLDGDGFAEVVEIWKVKYRYAGNGKKQLDYEPVDIIEIKKEV